jgi:hypothetical protein
MQTPPTHYFLESSRLLVAYMKTHPYSIGCCKAFTNEWNYTWPSKNIYIYIYILKITKSHVSPWQRDEFTAMTPRWWYRYWIVIYANHLYKRTPPSSPFFLYDFPTFTLRIVPNERLFLEAQDWAHSHEWTTCEQCDELHSLGSLFVVKNYSLNIISWISGVWIHDEKMVNRDQVVDIGSGLPQ